MTMRIAFSFPYALGRVGVGRTALAQVNGLAERGHDVLVSAPLVSAGAQVDDRVVVFESRAVAGRRLPARVVRAAGTARLHDLRTRRWLRAQHRTRPIDVLHAWPLAGTRTMRAARDVGMVVVREAPNTHTGHGYDVVERETRALGLQTPPENSHFRDPVHLALEEGEWALADAILAPSDAVRESFIGRGFAPERIVRHRYGCDLPPETMRPPLEPGAPFRALFLGAAEPRKGLHIALEAWARSNRSEHGTFRVAGRFMPGYRERIAGLLALSGVEELGFVEDPAALLAESDVLLLPSFEEGSAIVTYEAQAAGCIPLVSWEAGALMDVGVHGLEHSAGDAAALAAQMDAVGGDLELRARLRDACARDRDRLGWDSAAEALESAYLKVLAARRLSA